MGLRDGVEAHGETLGKSAWMLIGEEKTKFIAKYLQLKGGGHPGSTAVINAIAKCKQPG